MCEGREVREDIQPSPVIVGVDEVVGMRRQLGMAVMMVLVQDRLNYVVLLDGLPLPSGCSHAEHVP